MSSRISRRGLLKGMSACAAGWVLLRDSRSVYGYPANEMVATAHIGAGGRGGDLLAMAFEKQARPVALCDVNEQRAADAYKRNPDVPRFQDFRVMLEKMGKQIDAVVVATPDHIHAVATAAAIRAGKPVYTEKPLTRLVGESRTLRALAKEKKVATSMGNQGTAAGPYRRAMELIQDGALGRIKEIIVWNDQGGPGHKEAPKDPAKVPPYLNWDLWLGPARDRPFSAKWLAWAGWRDFGTSQLGNWASHTANLAFRSMKVDSLWYADPATKPVLRVEAKAAEISRLSYPRWEMITWDVPARGDLPAIAFHWYNGPGPGVREKLEAALGRDLDWGDKGQKKWADWAGCLIIGTEGTIYSTGHNATFTLTPEERFKDLKKDQPLRLEKSAGHEQDWLQACRGGKPAWANFDYAGPLNEFLQLGNLATMFEGKLEYDPLSGKITNNPDADKALQPEYREGWAL